MKIEIPFIAGCLNLFLNSSEGNNEKTENQLFVRLL